MSSLKTELHYSNFGRLVFYTSVYFQAFKIFVGELSLEMYEACAEV